MREIVSPLDGIRSPFGRRGGAPAFALTVVGQDSQLGIATDSIGTYGVIGEHAFIGYEAALNGASVPLDAVKWSNSSNPASAATYGTGPNPTDIAAADEGTVFLHGQYGGVWYTRQFDVRYRPGSLPAFAPQSFATGAGGTYQHPAAIGPGLTWTYAQVSAVAGVTYGGTRTFTFATSLADQAGTVFGASATDQYGRPASGSPRTSTFTIAAADVTAPTASNFTLSAQDEAGDVTATIVGLSENSTLGLVWTSTNQSAATASAVKTAAQGGTALTNQLSVETQALVVGGGPYIVTDGLPSGYSGTAYWQAVLWDAANNISSVFSGSVTLGVATITPIETLQISSWSGSANVDRTLTFTQTLQQNDFILVTRCRHGSAGLTGLSGYTVRQNNLNLNTNQGVIRTEYLFAGSTPPTSVFIPVEDAGANESATYRVQVFRGVNPSSPFSVADTTANGNVFTLAASSITPAHDDCYIYCSAVYNDRDGTVFTWWSGLTEVRSQVVAGNGGVTSSHASFSAGQLLTGGSGTPFSPGTLQIGSSGPAEGMTSITMALRPA
jgi:hypothetical protein